MTPSSRVRRCCSFSQMYELAWKFLGAVAWRGGARSRPKQSNQEKSMAESACATNRVTTHPDNQGFSKLPIVVQLEVMSYLYHDLDSLAALFAAFQAILSHILHSDLKRSIRYSILYDSLATSHRDSVFCRICNRPTCYPYQLVDASCGHQVCGACAWNFRMGSCGCGIKIRTRPKRLDSHLANSRAFWLLSTKGRFMRLFFVYLYLYPVYVCCAFSTCSIL
jgi:hypothetical protein